MVYTYTGKVDTMEAYDVVEDCSIIQAISILGKKWVVFILTELIINHIKQGKGLYFSELQMQVRDNYGGKISSRVLTDSLTLLENVGLIDRLVLTDTKPVHVEYRLTEKGIDFQVVLSALKGWGIKHGSVRQKLCQSFSCVHDSVPYMDIDKAWENLVSKPVKGEGDVDIL